MTKEELLERLNRLNDKNDDPEMLHYGACQCILAFIDDDEITEAFSEVPKRRE